MDFINKDYTVYQLLLNFNNQKNYYYNFSKQDFVDIKNKDFYNPSVPFLYKEKIYMAVRVESRNSETDTKIMFFYKKNEQSNTWQFDKEAPEFNLQDPFINFLNNELVFGGVKVKEIENNRLLWKTLFYRGKTISELELFAESPYEMKDIRLVQLPKNKIGVFIRPEGKIAFCIIDKLEDFKQVFEKAFIIENIYTDREWGGVNEPVYLKDNLIGVLGHIACYGTDKNRHYYPFTFVYNYVDNKILDKKIIAKRDLLPAGPKKKPDLKDIMFSSGFFKYNNKFYFYTGVSDTEIYKIELEDPFKDYR